MTQDSSDGSTSGPTARVAATAAIFVGLLIGLGAASNKLLDNAGRPDTRAVTADQQERAPARSGPASTLSASKMCGDAGILLTVKKLINDQTLNIAKWGNAIGTLDAARGDGLAGAIKAKEEHLQKTKEMYLQSPIDPNSRYYGNPAQERAQHLAELEADLVRLRAKKVEQDKAPKPQIAVTENEIIITSAPILTEVDPRTNRAACKLTYKVKGFGYDNTAVQLGSPTTAVYTIQQNDTDWIVNVVSLS